MNKREALKIFKKLQVEKTQKEEIKFLESKGWHTWYNEDYWVHPIVVAGSSRQDYTNYGMPRSEAIAFEKEGRKPFQTSLLAGLMGSGAMQNNYNRGK